jgi:hypothetical protein
MLSSQAAYVRAGHDFSTWAEGEGLCLREGWSRSVPAVGCVLYRYKRGAAKAPNDGVDGPY